jgi:bacterial extracellular solute-binding proteins, family 5 middle
MVNIECIINEDAKWSNGENITTEDLVATYQLIKETGSNKILVSLLQSTEIETRDNNTIIFKNTRKDTNFLNVFLQPILNKKFIDTLSKENIT